ncbi:restriction endonuclease subunit S [Cellulophaga sp. HaHa_2_1]|uniref:restriction endonuclease subunit S n=1 Tax=Cellulophaga sp. HaHa_2_1 TaxID=2749994 RepID=UPI001C4FC2AF|nr:restriction endonuclease subunit S [Cellulophaga sp. HaHa_2_1]QXP53806.1 restriction endonuclease subunit S [Cellulophaga sp. HaHa_2_1]
MAFLKDIIEKPLTGEWGTDGNEVNVLRTTNFTNSGILDFSNVVKRNISEKKVEQKKLLKGDIIIEKSGGSPKQPVGRVVFFNEEGVYLCNNFTSILRPKKEKVEPKYLHYLLYASHRFGVTGMFQNKTTGIINLQLPRYVNKLEIPLPALKTQQHIAQILDDASALRDKTKKLLKEYDLLAKSLFLEMFGDPVINPKRWEKKALKDFLINVKNGITRRPKTKEDESGDVVLKLKHVRSNFINYDCENKILLNDLEKQKFRINTGDLLFIRVNGNPNYVGRCALHNDENYEVFFNDHIMRVRYDKTKYNGQFLCLYLNYPYGQREISKRVKTSAGQHTINQGGLEKLNLILPPINLQNKFAEKIDLIEQQKELAKQELQESEDLFNCLLQKAFKGELV